MNQPPKPDPRSLADALITLFALGAITLALYRALEFIGRLGR